MSSRFGKTASTHHAVSAFATPLRRRGTIGIIDGTSASIESLFALAYRRSHVLGAETLYEINPLLVEFAEHRALDVHRIVEKVRETGNLAAVPGVPEDLRRLFVTALEIPAERHLQIQAAFQKHVDNSVSKTINLRTTRNPRKLYLRAWQLGLKGITIYRYGSRSSQVLELGVNEEAHHFDYTSRCDPDECRI